MQLDERNRTHFRSSNLFGCSKRGERKAVGPPGRRVGFGDRFRSWKSIRSDRIGSGEIGSEIIPDALCFVFGRSICVDPVKEGAETEQYTQRLCAEVHRPSVYTSQQASCFEFLLANRIREPATGVPPGYFSLITLAKVPHAIFFLHIFPTLELHCYLRAIEAAAHLRQLEIASSFKSTPLEPWYATGVYKNTRADCQMIKFWDALRLSVPLDCFREVTLPRDPGSSSRPLAKIVVSPASCSAPSSTSVPSRRDRSPTNATATSTSPKGEGGSQLPLRALRMALLIPRFPHTTAGSALADSLARYDPNPSKTPSSASPENKATKEKNKAKADVAEAEPKSARKRYSSVEISPAGVEGDVEPVADRSGYIEATHGGADGSDADDHPAIHFLVCGEDGDRGRGPDEGRAGGPCGLEMAICSNAAKAAQAAVAGEGLRGAAGGGNYDLLERGERGERDCGCGCGARERGEARVAHGHDFSGGSASNIIASNRPPTSSTALSSSSPYASLLPP
ncbi:hypothetical protein BDK51DRAFT_48749 [Blyttiomyces helicus]|uniref:Uncharacterized protein n=1 Tax=Blyttiomyces helicus TaxID=388810 RepID=A0A4P9W7Z3_9FUNG|nr:hypothetical protein BDK51DRAFT_48749 [Blyttiomyces helicus]|eukprot:RKO87525.1 hypothetical protein BDK51DRAFT_48749 [Blyttiomyces helicus]